MKLWARLMGKTKCQLPRDEDEAYLAVRMNSVRHAITAVQAIRTAATNISKMGTEGLGLEPPDVIAMRAEAEKILDALLPLKLHGNCLVEVTINPAGKLATVVKREGITDAFTPVQPAKNTPSRVDMIPERRKALDEELEALKRIDNNRGAS